MSFISELTVRGTPRVRKVPDLVSGNCVQCGAEFKTASRKAVTCSQKCNVKKWRLLNPNKAKASEIRSGKKRLGVYRYNSESRRSWYAKKKCDKSWADRIRLQGNGRSLKVKKFLSDYKLGIGCHDCGFSGHHVALDFDHVSGKKRINVCFAKSISMAIEEIKKCEVVCANCHRIRTFNRIHKIKMNSKDSKYVTHI